MSSTKGDEGKHEAKFGDEKTIKSRDIHERPVENQAERREVSQMRGDKHNDDPNSDQKRRRGDDPDIHVHGLRYEKEVTPSPQRLLITTVSPRQISRMFCCTKNKGWIGMIDGQPYSIHKPKTMLCMAIDSLKPIFGIRKTGRFLATWRGITVVATPMIFSSWKKGSSDSSRIMFFRWICGITASSKYLATFDDGSGECCSYSDDTVPSEEYPPIPAGVNWTLASKSLVSNRADVQLYSLVREALSHHREHVHLGNTIINRLQVSSGFDEAWRVKQTD